MGGTDAPVDTWKLSQRDKNQLFELDPETAKSAAPRE